MEIFLHTKVKTSISFLFYFMDLIYFMDLVSFYILFKINYVLSHFCLSFLMLACNWKGMTQND